MLSFYRIQEQYDVSHKSHKGKIMNGSKERATKRYFKDAASRERRKQGKSRFDTFRREEQPDERDLRLEDIHFANFLGVKDSVGVPYNNTHINEPVNIIECDILRPEPEAETISQVGSEESDYGSWATQISREPNTKLNMNWDYEYDTQTLTCYSTFKRGHDDDVDEHNAKRMRSASDEIMRMEEGRLMNEQQQEEAIFEAMVAYMKQQIKIAQKIMEEDLYPCNCNR